MFLDAGMIQTRNAADIDADFGEIGHGIYIEAGANRAATERKAGRRHARRDPPA